MPLSRFVMCHFKSRYRLACLDARRAFYGRAAALVGAFLSARFLVFEAFVRSRFFSRTSLALTAFWDSRCGAPAALSCLFFLRPPSRASQSFPLFALWKFELGGGVGRLLASVLCLDVDFGFALLFADGNHQGGFEYALFEIARWGDDRPNGLK